MSLVGDGNDTVRTGSGAGKLHIAGTGKKNLHVGSGWSEI
jgi:hypothetical protein